MAERYIAFDVETPNHSNSRMSSIGVCVVEGGKIVRTYSSLVNPEQKFDRFNIGLTGITPAIVRDAPTFPELWEVLEPVFSSGTLVAHNASFDVRVLSTCLNDYDIYWRDRIRYVCTVSMGRQAYPELRSHKLDIMCSHCHIQLDHHKADSDARACALLLIDYMKHGLDPKDFYRYRSIAS